jgi:diguanylate cyclase (GGDEF)-like protein
MNAAFVDHRAPHTPGLLAARLTRLALLAAALALLLAGAALNGTMFVLNRNALVEDARTQAKLISANVVAPLIFADLSATKETLDTLAQSPRVARAVLFDRNGKVFARYERRSLPGLSAAKSSSPIESNPVPETAGHRFIGQYLVLDEDVINASTRAGMLRVVVPLAPLYNQSWVFGFSTLAALVLSLGVAWVMTAGVRRDIASIEHRLDELAHRDPVTGLFNRHAALQHMDRMIAESRRTGRGFSVVTLDLDDFKLINDTLGHPTGDEVLRQISRQLIAGMLPGARVYRFGGDEFVVVCPCPEGYADPARYGQFVRLALTATSKIAGHDLRLGGSVGVARYPDDGADSADLLRASDIAMYAAKAGGKGQVVVFEPGLLAHNAQQMQLEAELRKAIEQGELRLHYQPIVELATGRVLGAEALVRWQHPQQGLLQPSYFLGVAERTPLIVDLGAWVLQEAARQLAIWHQKGWPQLWVSVNVSARQLHHDVLARQYDQAMQLYGGDPHLLELELTEHTLVDDIEGHQQLLSGLRDRGVVIAIDDFGTGLSSLSYLKHLPVDKLKVDRSFVNGLPQDEGSAAIVGATLAMARAFGLRVVAEGIETLEQLAMLQALGCDFGQGYLFSKPIEATSFERLLHQQSQWRATCQLDA